MAGPARRSQLIPGENNLKKSNIQHRRQLINVTVKDRQAKMKADPGTGVPGSNGPGSSERGGASTDEEVGRV